MYICDSCQYQSASKLGKCPQCGTFGSFRDDVHAEKNDGRNLVDAQKNRFGHTDDIGIFEMKEDGLQPVYDIKQRMMDLASSMPWSVLTVWLDNGRPVVAHVEVLINKKSLAIDKYIGSIQISALMFRHQTAVALTRRRSFFMPKYYNENRRNQSHHRPST